MGFTKQLDLKRGTIRSIRVPEQTFTEQERAGESPESPRLAKEIREKCFLPLQQQLADPSRPTYTPVSSGKDKLPGNSARFTYHVSPICKYSCIYAIHCFLIWNIP